MTCRPENDPLDSAFSILGEAFGSFAYGGNETFFVCEPAEAGFADVTSPVVILPGVTDGDYADPRTYGCQEAFFQASRCYEDTEFLSADDGNDDESASQTSSASSTSSIATPAVYTGLASKRAGTGLIGAMVGAGVALLL